MTSLQIDPRHRPLRGVRAISRYLDNQDEQITLRQIHRGMIDATLDGRMYVSTPARIDNSPVIVGRRPSAETASADQCLR
jgi:hypothetical protein